MGVFYWSLLEVFIWGLISRYLHSVGGETFGFVTVLVGAVIFWNFFTRTMNGISVSFLEDVWSRNLINLFSSPLTIGEYAAGLIVTSIVHTVFSIAGMVAMAWLFFSYNIFLFGFFLIPFVFLLFLFGWTIGIFATAFILRFGPAVEILVWSAPALIMPFAAVFYPVEALPGAFRPISYLIPISYVFEGMRRAAIGGTFDVRFFIIALVLSVFYFAGAIFVFIKMYHIVLKRGLFTRFMTE